MPDDSARPALPAGKLSHADVLRHCRLRDVRRMFGWDELAKLFGPGGEGPDEYSIKPFIRTNSVFVHLPKTAGVSIARALYGNRGMGHFPVSRLQRLFRPRAFAGMFKFTFVRNPFDRIHSAYHFLRAGGMGGLDLEFDRRVLRNFPSFEHFVLDGLERKEVASFYHFIPQAKFLGFDRDNPPQGGPSCALDFIGRYENLERDFAYVKSRVNPSARLPHLNRTPAKPDYRREYTPEMVDRVADRYAVSLEVLGYDFDGPKRHIEVPLRHAA